MTVTILIYYDMMYIYGYDFISNQSLGKVYLYYVFEIYEVVMTKVKHMLSTVSEAVRKIIGSTSILSASKSRFLLNRITFLFSLIYEIFSHKITLLKLQI